ncbi:hypothetical protein HGP17_08070 [Rhizobium sp. P38BS-XIX]|uniref:hypothetical protein n=1 Tax=Rhizobium sp. P38BS-XIX TaxID=2726740 RepID=UPI00145757A9|nr:hypothetical protein [Rhizobium sp. P38BS-XIX]NLR96790.1 hypothetical protein [Rhizobium sp. P38BS-XIX]
MAIPHSFDTTLAKARTTLDDAIGSANAALATLAGHVKGEGRTETINVPVEEALVREAVELLERWKSLGAALVKDLDQVTAQADLQHRRLFDEKAGLENAGLVRRKLARGPLKPEAIVADLNVALAISAELDLLFKQARPVFSYSFHDCEIQLEGMIERRQKVDFEIEEVLRRSDVLAARIMDRRRSVPADDEDIDVEQELEEDDRALVDEQERLGAKERELQASRTVCQRLIDIYEGLATALNAQIAAVGAMAGKLTVDIEQRIALLKALAPEVAPSLASVRSPAVESLLRAFEMNVLAGHDLAARKAHVDGVFTRRLEPHLLPPLPDVREEVDEVQPEG